MRINRGHIAGRVVYRVKYEQLSNHKPGGAFFVHVSVKENTPECTLFVEYRDAYGPGENCATWREYCAKKRAEFIAES